MICLSKIISIYLYPFRIGIVQSAYAYMLPDIEQQYTHE